MMKFLQKMLSIVMELFRNEAPVLDPESNLPEELVVLKETIIRYYNEDVFSRYSIRRALQKTLGTYSENIVDLDYCVTVLHQCVIGGEYSPDRWKMRKRELAVRFLDAFFSDADGFDITPQRDLPGIVIKLTEVLNTLEDIYQTNEHKGNYYLRQFKSVFTDSTEVLEAMLKLPH